MAETRCYFLFILSPAARPATHLTRSATSEISGFRKFALMDTKIMKKGIEGKVVVITGASSGIGRLWSPWHIKLDVRSYLTMPFRAN